MSRCNCRFLRAISAGLIGAFRFLLCLGVVILLVGTIFKGFTFIWFSRDGMVDVLPRTGLQLKIYAIILSTFVLSLFGVHGSFCLHPGSLKMFSIFGLANALAIILILSSGSVRDENRKYYDQLSIYMPLYEWEKEGELIRKEPNMNWDGLQNFQCCGIHSYKDWDSFRPVGIAADLYPSSCCFRPGPPLSPTMFPSKLSRAAGLPHPPTPGPEPPSPNELCKKDEFLYTTGCFERTRQVEVLLLGNLLSFGMVICHLLLAVLASFVHCHERRRQAQQAAAREEVLRGSSRQEAPVKSSDINPPPYSQLDSVTYSPLSYGALE